MWTQMTESSLYKALPDITLVKPSTLMYRLGHHSMQRDFLTLRQNPVSQTVSLLRDKKDANSLVEIQAFQYIPARGTLINVSDQEF